MAGAAPCSGLPEEPRGIGAEDAAAFRDEQFRIWIPVIRASGAMAE